MLVFRNARLYRPVERDRKGHDFAIATLWEYPRNEPEVALSQYMAVASWPPGISDIGITEYVRLREDGL